MGERGERVRVRELRERERERERMYIYLKHFPSEYPKKNNQSTFAFIYFLSSAPPTNLSFIFIFPISHYHTKKSKIKKNKKIKKEEEGKSNSKIKIKIKITITMKFFTASVLVGLASLVATENVSDVSDYFYGLDATDVAPYSCTSAS